MLEDGSEIEVSPDLKSYITCRLPSLFGHYTMRVLEGSPNY